MVQLIKKHFVAVAPVDTRATGTPDNSDGEFLQAVRRGSHFCATADGKPLGSDVAEALKLWQQLPEAQRRPGAVQLGPRQFGKHKPDPEPPKGGLILKVHVRMLARQGNGDLRRATRQDFPDKLFDASLEAQPGFIWLTRDQWKSLLPAEPRVGNTFPMPALVADPIIHTRLHPHLAFGHSVGWREKEVRSSELTVTVEEASPARIRLILHGEVQLGDPYDPDVVITRETTKLGYHPRLDGRLEYDRQKDVVTRFDLAAVGDNWGNAYALCCCRPGAQPLGICFELASSDIAANRVMPSGPPAVLGVHAR